MNNSTGFRRRLAIGSGVLLTLATLVPLTASADDSGTSTKTESGSTTSTTGAVTNITTALTGRYLSEGDYISAGWAIGMAGKHAAATVSVTKLLATIPLQCQVDDDHPQPLNVVVHLPDASVTIPANDSSWHPTASAADVKGYEARVLVGSLCQDGSLTPHGKATYAAKLLSTDTKDSFAIRFHSVDARTNSAGDDDDQVNSNTDCTSTTQNRSAVSQCNAAWTPSTRLLAAAPPSTSGSGGTVSGPTGSEPNGVGEGTKPSSPATGHPSVPGLVTGIKGIVNGVTGKVTGTVAGGVGALITPLPVLGHVLHSVLPHARGEINAPSGNTSASAAQQPGSVPGSTTQPLAPLLILPPPSQSTVLGPVPLPVPVINSVAAGIGGALPWRWFLLLAILDLGLIVGIVLRRRSSQRDRLNAR